MRVAITGASGFIGRQLLRRLKSRKHEVCPLVRRKSQPGEISWNPGEDLPAGALDGFDAVIHLAGENVASGRWTPARKESIRASRVDGTRVIASAVASLEQPPRVLICASAMGFYGRPGDRPVSERDPAGDGFLPSLCSEWEAAAQPARDAGVRVVHPRIGIVLGPGGGAVSRMLLPFKLGLGGRLGNGHQFMSWIAREDVVGVMETALHDERYEGPVNAVTGAVTNREFTRALGRVLGRWTIFPMPAFMIRLMLGEMGRDLLLGSLRVEPLRLRELGYEFRVPGLDEALLESVGENG